MSGTGPDPNVLNAIAHPATVNLLEDYQGAARTANSIWQNREWQAKQAAGAAFQNALNPDGTTNQPQFNRNLQAAGPTASLAAIPSSQAGLTNATDEFSLNMKRLTGVNAAAMALTAQYPNGVPQSAVNAELDRVGPTYGLTPEQIAKAKTSFGADPVSNSRTIIRNGIANLSAQEALHASQVGTGSVTGPGGVATGTTQAPAAAGPGQAGAISVPQQAGAPQGLTPAEGAQRVPTVDNNMFLPDGKTPNPNYGQAITVPLQSTMPGARPSSGAVPPPSPTNQPRLTPAPAPQSGSASSGGALPTALPPGADIPIKAANDAWAAAQVNDNTYAQRMFPITQAQALAKTPGLVTGEGSETINNLKSWLQTRLSSLPGFNAQTIANSNFQDLNKFLQQAINAEPMASGSDARLASAIAGRPGVHLNNLALDQALTAQTGLMRMQHMADIAFSAAGAPNGQYNNFLRDWQTTVDPRAFVADQMTRDQQTKMVAAMNPSERTAFSKTLGLIRAHPEIMNSAPMPAAQ